jgi:hypothetical protein
MGKVKIIIGVALFAAAAYYAVKLTAPENRPVQAPTASTQPGPAPTAPQLPQGEVPVQETLGLAGLSKGALGTVKISENLSVPASKLRGCTMMKKPDPNPYLQADTNPFFTEKAEDVDFIAKIGFGTIPLVDVAQGGALLFSSPSGEKTGAWLLQFKNEEAANMAMGMMRPAVTLKKGGLLMTFWHDAGEDCELSVRTYFVDKGFTSGMGGPR